ncbi:hypothetical protein BC831DRAFT_442044 [Entophlyctis helioformis]|nr:hypothetical protein BC831DRAFT_442044 [Entophlyctis helioformis]
MSNLNALPQELLLLISNCLEPAELAAVCRTCIRWRALALPLLYNEPVLDRWSTFAKFEAAVLASAALGSLVRHLDLCSVPHRWDKLSQARADSLIRACPNLLSIDLELCSSVGNSTPTTIAASCKRIQSVTLTQCAKITDAGIVALGACPELRFLDASRLPRVTDLSIVHLCTVAPRLESLNIAATRVTDKAVRLAFQKLLKLKYVDLSACYNIEDVDALVASAPEGVETVTDSLEPGAAEWIGEDEADALAEQGLEAFGPDGQLWSVAAASASNGDTFPISDYLLEFGSNGSPSSTD